MLNITNPIFMPKYPAFWQQTSKRVRIFPLAIYDMRFTTRAESTSAMRWGMLSSQAILRPKYKAQSSATRISPTPRFTVKPEIKSRPAFLISPPPAMQPELLSLEPSTVSLKVPERGGYEIKNLTANRSPSSRFIRIHPSPFIRIIQPWTINIRSYPRPEMRKKVFDSLIE